MSDYRGYAMVVKTVSHGRYHLLYLDCGHYTTCHTSWVYKKVKCIACLIDTHATRYPDTSLVMIGEKKNERNPKI